MTGATWSDDDSIVFGALNYGLFRVPPSGGEAVPLETSEERGDARWPFVLPGGRALLFEAVNQVGESAVRVRSLDDGTEKILVRGATFPSYTTSGHLIYVSDSVLWAAAAGTTSLPTAVPYVTANVLKNRTEISILLMTPDAHEKIDSVIDLTSVVASKLD